MSKVIFRFSFDKIHHADVIRILESIPKSMRTMFVVDVIRYSMSQIMQIPVKKLENLDKKENKKISSVDKQEELSISVKHNEFTEDKGKTEKQPLGNLSISLKNVFGSANNLLKGE